MAISWLLLAHPEVRGRINLITSRSRRVGRSFWSTQAWATAITCRLKGRSTSESSVSPRMCRLAVDSNAHDEGHVRWLFAIIKHSRNVEFSTEGGNRQIHCPLRIQRACNYLKIKDRGWRRERDSNPRNPFGFSGFQDHRHRPLGHPSASKSGVNSLARSACRGLLDRMPLKCNRRRLYREAFLTWATASATQAAGSA